MATNKTKALTSRVPMDMFVEVVELGEKRGMNKNDITSYLIQKGLDLVNGKITGGTGSREEPVDRPSVDASYDAALSAALSFLIDANQMLIECSDIGDGSKSRERLDKYLAEVVDFSKKVEKHLSMSDFYLGRAVGELRTSTLYD